MVTLYKYFASIGKIDSGPVHNFPSLVDDEKCMRDVTVTESDVLRAICKMKANASSGPDGLPPVLFKKLKHSLTTPLTPSIHPCLFLRKNQIRNMEHTLVQSKIRVVQQDTVVY